MHKLLKILCKIFFTLIGVILVYGIIALISSCIVFKGKNKTNPDTDKVLYITSNGVHTSFVLPYEDFESLIKLSDYQEIKGRDYIMIGWGDQDFYMNVPEWKDLTLKTALCSTLLPTPSAMHVTLIQQPVLDDYTQQVIVSESSYNILIENIKSTFVLEQNQPILFLNKGYSKSDNFYEAHGSYHAFNTCNSWTNRMMKEAELKHCLWTPFSFTVMNLYDE